MKITLTELEIRFALNCVYETQKNVRDKGLVDPTNGTYQQKWGHQTMGAFGEIALHKALGLYYDGNVNTFKKFSDLPFKIQVRTTNYNDGFLTLYDTDQKDHYFFLITGEIPTLTIRGSILCKNGISIAKVKEPPEVRSKIYTVQQNQLEPFKLKEVQIYMAEQLIKRLKNEN